VVVHDRARAAPGLNLYVSGHAPEAVLMDMAGRPLHRWRYPFARAFPGKRADTQSGYFRRAALLPDGGLFALYQGAGVVRLDRRSRLLRAYDAGFYNDLEVDARGHLWGLTKEARRVPELNAREPVLEDFLVELGPDGRPLRRVSLLRALLGSPFARLLRPLPPAGDIFHSNTVEVLRATAGAPEPFVPGRVLVSFREIDVVALVDPARGAIVWARRGPWDAQHQPTLLPGGRLLVFDNLGYRGHSRVLELDLAGGAIAWEFHGTPPEAFSSPEAGSCQRLANGNTLITESERGRAFEVTPDGAVVWEFRSPHRAGRSGELVATLFEVVRLPPAAFVPERGR
ncbi:MAG TPA: arylsulfotransferase family protein, partial [Thermoanaerobaculia bacterium]|nr:arylsulfotransferase family protein [Thermoanaerobaculia bacterium]